MVLGSVDALLLRRMHFSQTSAATPFAPLLDDSRNDPDGALDPRNSSHPLPGAGLYLLWAIWRFPLTLLPTAHGMAISENE